MAKHSIIVGLGVDSVQRGDVDEPCIVIHCLDKSLVPFGEKPLPKFIEGFPVEIREDFVFFGYCANCTSLEAGCGIGRPSHPSAGSVGFPVRSNDSPSERGFLTASHVALEDFEKLYETNTLLSENPLNQTVHRIVHPPFIETHNNNFIGNVVESFCGNYGQYGTGIDAAYVKVYKPKLGGTCIHIYSVEFD